MKKIFLTMSLLAVAGFASAQTPPAKPTEPVETLGHDTAGVIMITLDDEPELFIFISNHGLVIATPAEACAKEPKCADLATSLAEQGKANVLPIHSAPKHGGTDT